jgi:hypothetical protein
MKRKWKDLGPFWRRGGVVGGAAVLALAAQGLDVSLAPEARADRTVTVNELCNNYRAGYLPVIAAFTLGELICIAPGYLNPMPGLTDSNEGRVKPGVLPGLAAGSFRVNPLDPFSAWVIPG